FTRAQVALQVGGVVVRVPQTPLDEAEKLYGLRGLGVVRHLDLMHLVVRTDRHEIKGADLDAVTLTRDPRVAHAVAALVLLELGLNEHVRRRPEVTAVVDIEVTSTGVSRNVVVTETRQATETRVAMKAIASSLVRDDAEELLSPEVIDPRVRSLRSGDDVLAVAVVKVAKTHGVSSKGFLWGRRGGAKTGSAGRVLEGACCTDKRLEFCAGSLPIETRQRNLLVALFRQEVRYPRERCVPVDRDLVGRPGFDVIDETFGGFAPLQTSSFDIRIL